MERFKELLEKFTCNDCDEPLTAEELAELAELTKTQFESARDGKDLKRAEKFANVLARINEASAELESKAAEDEAAMNEIERLAGLRDEEPEVEAEAELEVEEEIKVETPKIVIELGDIDISQFVTAEEPAADEVEDKEETFLNLTAQFGGAGLNAGDKIKNRAELKDYLMGVFKNMNSRSEAGKTYAASGTIEKDWAGEIDPDRFQDAHHVTQVLWDVMEAEQNAAITADGSFCAPVEPDLRFCDLTGPITGLFTLPSVRAPRGRLQYMATPRFDDIYALTGIGELFTEANSIAVDPADDATWKSCAEVDCPSQQAVTAIDAIYTCLTYKHFTANSYPEYIDFFVRNALKAHVYKQNTELLTKALAVATPLAADIAPAINSTAALLNALEQKAYSLKRAYWVADDTAIEIALPEWVSMMIRGDIAIRQYGDPAAIFSVSDAEVTRLFNERGFRVQWLKNWQRIGTTGTAANEGLGAVGDLTLYPTTFDILAWIPGTLVSMEAPNFNIGFDVIRDGSLIRQNAYQGFTETFEGLAQPCDHQVQTWTVAFCPAGETSGPVTVDCDLLVTPAT